MSNVVDFPKGHGPRADVDQPVVVTITDHDGSTLAAVPIIAPSQGVSLLVSMDQAKRRRAIAALRYALAELARPDTDPHADPEIGSDWTPL